MEDETQGAEEAQNLETIAINLVRRARRSCEAVGTIGYRFVGLADWVEGQIPRLRSACVEAVRDALGEPPSAGSKREE